MGDEERERSELGQAQNTPDSACLGLFSQFWLLLAGVLLFYQLQGRTAGKQIVLSGQLQRSKSPIHFVRTPIAILFALSEQQAMAVSVGLGAFSPMSFA